MGDGLTPALQEIVARATALYEDLDLSSVAAWKTAVPGRKAVGYMPIYVPREIVHAAGALPVGVMGAGDRLEIIRGDAYFQSYICHIPRSTVELALSKRLDVLDGMLFPSICDVIRNLSGMWNLLFPDRYVRYVDVPQNFSPEAGGYFWRLELQALREEMSALTGQPVTDERLRESIEVYNDNRRALRRLYEARSDTPWAYPASEMYLVLRAGNVLPPGEHTRLLDAYREEAPGQEGRSDRDHSRIVLVGAFCEQPPLGLLVTLERAGCWVVDDDLLLGMRWLEEDVRTDGNPVEALAEAFLAHSAHTASKYEPEKVKGRALIESVRRNRAEGVIFSAPSFCDPALLDQPMLAAALEREGIPYTHFKYSEDTGQFAAIREQAGTFSDSIRLWSET